MTQDFSDQAPDGEMAPEQLAQAATALSSGAASIAIGGDAPNATVQIFHLHFDGASRPLTEETLAALGETLRKRLPPVLNNLQPVATAFAGRETEENEIFAQLARGGGAAAISALRGIGGVGKTALAVKIAHRMTPFYPAAQILVDLRGTGEAPVTPRAAMADVFLRFYPDAKPPDDEGKLGEVYRDLLKRNKCLLILDNAHDAAQVAPLLPPPPSGALVTSRRTLDCAEIRTTRLDDLPLEDAKKLILDLVTGERALGESELTDLAERACCRHPLSLKVAALFLRGRKGQSVKAYVERVVKERERLRIEGLPDHDVMAVLGQSVGQLAQDKPGLVEAWRMLCVFPVDFGTDAAAAVWESGDREQACDDLNLLESFGLIEVLREERYKLHDLLRDLARKDLGDENFEAAALRHSQYFEAALARADDLYLQGGEAVLQGLSLFDLERVHILAGQSWAARRLETSDAAAALAARYANAGVYVLALRLPPRQWIAWLESQLEGCRRTGNRSGEGAALGNLGIAYDQLGEGRKAIEYHDQNLAVAREICDRRGECNALGNLGVANNALGEQRKAIKYHKQALTISREIGDRRREGAILGNLGIAHMDLGEPRKAIDYYKRQLTIVREIGDRRGEANALANMGRPLQIEDPTRARACARQALEIFRAIDDPYAARLEQWLKKLGSKPEQTSQTAEAPMSDEKNVTASGPGAISIRGSAKNTKITTHVETSGPVSPEAAPRPPSSEGAGGIKSPAEALAALEAAARSHPEFFKARKTVVASGTGAIAIGGNVEGSVIRTHVLEIGGRPPTQPPEDRPPEFPALDREVDLILRIRAKSGDDYWLDAKTAGRQMAPVVKALPRAREFASKLAEFSRDAGGAELALSLLRALGKTIAGALPSDWLKPQGPLAAAFADSRKTPSILILSDEAFIPWELAWIDGPNPGFLGERAKVGRWPVDAPPPPSQARLGAFHVFAATSYADAGAIDLPNSLEEQSELVKAHQGVPHEAVEKELVDWLYAPREGAASFHLAVHGYNDPKADDQALILGDGTRLKPEHLLAIKEDGVARTYALVFLNACQTGSGGDSLGQVAGFPGVMARSGSGAIIAPLWEVGDAAARDFAVNFYDRILTQESEVAMALKLLRAQLKDACGLHRYAYAFFGHPLLKISY